MSAVFRIDVAKGRVFSSGAGHLTYEDLAGHMNRLLKHPHFDPSFSQLLDFREIETLDITSSDVIALAEVRVFLPASKRAFVAPGAAKFGMARMYEAYRIPKGDNYIRVFADYDEAVEWLDSEQPSSPADTSDSGAKSRHPR
jgi:hypothetical protein